MLARGSGDSCNGADTAQQKWQNTLSRLTYVSPDGTETEFRDLNSFGQEEPTNGSGYNRGTAFAAFDSSSSTVTTTSAITDPSAGCQAPKTATPGTMVLRDGTTYTFDTAAADVGYLTQIEDRNGNLLTINRSQTPNQITVADAFDRTTTITKGTGSNPDTITYPGEGGTLRTVKVFYANLDAVLDTGQAISTTHTIFSNIPLCSPGAQDCAVDQTYDPSGFVSQIELPNGQSYTFKYNNTGDVTTLILPTGGMYRYTYIAPNSGIFAAQTGNAFAYTITRPLVQKSFFTSSTATTPVETINYTQNNFSSGTITYEDGSKEVHYGTVESAPTINGVQYMPWVNGLETEVDYYDTDGATILKKVATPFAQRPCAAPEICWFNVATTTSPSHDPRISSQVTTQNAQVAEQDYQYDNFNNRTQVVEYDFGNGSKGSLIRTTNSVFEQIGNISSLPQSVQVLVSGTGTNLLTCGNSQLAASTQYSYDQTAPQSYSSITAHDSSVGNHGNATTISQCLYDTIHNPSGQTLSTTVSYDIAGNVVKVVDPNPRNVETNYSYSDSLNTFALPTTITHYPLLGSTSPAFADTYAYDYNIGKLLSHTDVDDNQTKYGYSSADGLDRLAKITRPDTSTTVFMYNDTPGSLSLTTAEDQKTAGDGVVRNEVDYDGLGRRQDTKQFEASGTSYYIETDTLYDNRGRVSQVSNPYRPGTTPVYTTSGYDGISRVKTVTYPDGSVASNSYYGNQVLAKDAASVNRVTTTDAAGRVLTVLENCNTSWNGGSCPSSSQSQYTTSHVYNALDDLTSVSQSGLSRTFVYDSLKRLVKATNPENGAITYTYDNSGNLISKVDALSKTTTLGTYDGLNRNSSKTYTDGTAAVSYCYDGYTAELVGTGVACSGASSGDTLAKGHMTYAGNSSSNTQWTAFSSRGLVTATQQNTQVQGTNANYAFTYTYALNGKLKAMTYPSGRVVNTSYDPADRISLVNATTPDTVSYATLTTTPSQSIYAYAPHGAIQTLNLGNGIVENTTFNNRLQPTQITAGGLLTLGYGYNSGSNNGNVASATIARPSLSLSQSFTYDAVNRLWTATETGGSSDWSQTYGYDAFGNRAVTAGYIPNSGLTPTAVAQFTNNQWLGTGVSYDAAGNQRALPSRSFTYDAENRVITATEPNMAAISYVYDGEGKRVQKTVGTSLTTYVYDAFGNLAAEYATQATTNGLLYLTADALGSTRLATNSTGAAQECYDYFPFGEDIQQTIGGRGTCYPTGVYPSNPDIESMKFTAKERDAETGMDYFGARYFSGPQGRFTSADWSEKPQPVPSADFSDPQTLNLYAYVRNNPLSGADPTGHCGLDTCTSISEFLSSVPDRAKGGLKFEANAVLEMFRVAPKFQASNAEQADAMASGELIKPEFQQGLAMAFPGPKGEVGEALPNEALVVRGGLNKPENFVNGSGVTIDSNGNLQGVSVNSAPGKSVTELSQGVPNNKVGVTTVGDVRSAGGEVTPSGTEGNPNHCTMCGVRPQKASELMQVIPNPARKQEPQP